MLHQSFELKEIFQDETWKSAKLKEIIGTVKNNKFKAEMNRAGIYVFWWGGTLHELEKLHRKIAIKGKVIDASKTENHEKHHIHFLTFEIDWLHPVKIVNQENPFYALYIGKSTNILRRLGLHLKNKTGRNVWREEMLVKLPYSKYNYYQIKSPTTTCQFRSGMELLCLGIETEEAYWRIVNENIYFSYLTLDDLNKDKFVPHRFYLEDYLIGALRPWFNLDSER